MEFQKSEYFQKRAHKFYPSISRGFRLLKSTQSSLSRDSCCLSILYCLAVFVRCHISIFIFHLSSFIFHLSSFISHRTHTRKFPERLLSPSQRPPESFPTTPPEISRFPFGTKVIKILDLSPYLPPTRPFAVSPTLPYSPKPVLHQPRHQTESAPLVHQSPCTFYPHLTLSYNNPHQSSSSPTTPPDRIHSSRSSIAFHVLSSSHPVLQQHSSVQFITNHATRQNPRLSFINRLARSILISPCLTTTLISPVHHFLQLPSSLSRQITMHCSPSVWQFRTRRTGNCTEFEAVSIYVTLKKTTCIILRNLFGLYLFSSVMCHRHTPSSKTDLSSKIFS